MNKLLLLIALLPVTALAVPEERVVTLGATSPKLCTRWGPVNACGARQYQPVA